MLHPEVQVEGPWREDEPEFASLSLCPACCKHPSLQTFVKAHARPGLACAVCIPLVDPQACDVAARPEMMNLLAGLVRFHFDEFDYNEHWGATGSVGDLLTRDNPILETRNSLFNTRMNRERTQEALYNLFAEDPYPEPGISIYAGHDEGQRGLARSIGQTVSPLLYGLAHRAQNENAYRLEPEVFALIDAAGSRLDRTVRRGARYFRARTGVEGRFEERDGGWIPRVRDKPYTGETLGAPPPPKAQPGRLNRIGTAHLYLASDMETAAKEIRPHPGHKISVGQFEARSDLRIANFTTDIAAFVDSEAELDLFHFIHSTDGMMSVPIVPEERSRYLVTQLIADCLRQKGFAGVSYRSSVGAGENLCIFDPADFAFVEGSGEVFSVVSLDYEFTELPAMVEEDEDFMLMRSPAPV